MQVLSRKDAEHSKKLEAVETKLSEAGDQQLFLKEQLAAARVDTDLQLEKLRTEHEGQQRLSDSELAAKTATIGALRDDLVAREQELEFAREELQAKKEELEELGADLDIAEASFNNENKEQEERHKEEVEELVTKNEELVARIGQLSETIAVQRSECDAKVEEVTRARKAEVNDLKDVLSERESRILDLEAAAKDADSRAGSLESQLAGDAALAATKIEKAAAENETLRRSKYELETAVKNLNSERDHIVNLNQDLGLRIVEFEVQVKEMGSQFQSLQVEYEKRGVELTAKSEAVSAGAGSLADLEHCLSEERSRVDGLQVSLDEAETERDELRGRLTDLSGRVALVGQLEAANEDLTNQVADLTRKNEFLFEEIAKERLRLESKITTLAEKLEEQSIQRQTASADLESLKVGGVLLLIHLFSFLLIYPFLLYLSMDSMVCHLSSPLYVKLGIACSLKICPLLGPPSPSY